MKRFALSIILLLTCSAMLFAEVEFETRYTTTVGPGVVHKKIIAPTVPWELDVVEIDLTNPFITMEAILANDNILGRERTTAMARRIDSAGHRVVGAINGDFFDADGLTINAQITDGEMVKDENIDPQNITYWSTINFDAQNHPAITRNVFDSHVWFETGDRAVKSVNRTRYENHLVLYNKFKGEGTGTNQWGTEIRIRPLSDWIVNDTLLCVVEAKEVTVGNMTIPEGQAVLSGHGTSSTFLNDHAGTGDTLKLFVGLSGAPDDLVTLLGGFPRIVKNGQNYAYQGYAEEGGTSTFRTDRHPRSAVGFSADSTKLYFVTVDGRQDHSVGMNLIELADFMIGIGVFQAVNLDGGGSTTMVVRHDIKNSPSDGSERAVANALMTVSTAPAGQLAHIQIEPDHTETRLNGVIEFSTSGWDEHYGQVILNSGDLTYEVDDRLGTVTASGEFTAKANGASGYVYVYHGDLVDSAFVYIKAIESISLQPEFAVTDTVQTVEFTMHVVDEEGTEMVLNNTSFSWESTNTAVGTVDENGVFQGLMEGTTMVIAHFGEMSDSAQVRVEVGQDQMQLDDMDSGDNWNIEGLNLDTLNTRLTAVDTPKTYGDKALRVDYQFIESSTEYPWLYLNTDIPVYGIPDYIKLDFRGNGESHKMYIIASDNDNELFRASVRPFQRNTQFETIEYATTSFQAVEDGTFHYPIRIRAIEVRLGSDAAIGDTVRGTVYFDNLRVTYPLSTGLDDNRANGPPSHHRLFQNYPNPFNPMTTIRYTIGSPVETQDFASLQHINLSVYNIIGQKITTLVSEQQRGGSYAVQWDAGEFASGIYYCVLSVDERTVSSAKMLLVR